MNIFHIIVGSSKSIVESLLAKNEFVSGKIFTQEIASNKTLLVLESRDDYDYIRASMDNVVSSQDLSETTMGGGIASNPNPMMIVNNTDSVLTPFDLVPDGETDKIKKKCNQCGADLSDGCTVCPACQFEINEEIITGKYGDPEYLIKGEVVTRKGDGTVKVRIKSSPNIRDLGKEVDVKEVVESISGNVTESVKDLKQYDLVRISNTYKDGEFANSSGVAGEIIGDIAKVKINQSPNTKLLGRYWEIPISELSKNESIDPMDAYIKSLREDAETGTAPETIVQPEQTTKVNDVLDSLAAALAKKYNIPMDDAVRKVYKATNAGDKLDVTLLTDILLNDVPASESTNSVTSFIEELRLTSKTGMTEATGFKYGDVPDEHILSTLTSNGFTPMNRTHFSHYDVAPNSYILQGTNDDPGDWIFSITGKGPYLQFVSHDTDVVGGWDNALAITTISKAKSISKSMMSDDTVSAVTSIAGKIKSDNKMYDAYQKVLVKIIKNNNGVIV